MFNFSKHFVGLLETLDLAYFDTRPVTSTKQLQQQHQQPQLKQKQHHGPLHQQKSRAEYKEYTSLQNTKYIKYPSSMLLTLFQDDASGTIRLVIFYVSYAMFFLQFALSFVVDFRKKPRSNRPPDEQTFLLSAKSDEVSDTVSTVIIISVILNIPRTLNGSIL